MGWMLLNGKTTRRKRSYVFGYWRCCCLFAFGRHPLVVEAAPAIQPHADAEGQTAQLSSGARHARIRIRMAGRRAVLGKHGNSKRQRGGGIDTAFCKSDSLARTDPNEP